MEQLLLPNPSMYALSHTLVSFRMAVMFLPVLSVLLAPPRRKVGRAGSVAMVYASRPKRALTLAPPTVPLWRSQQWQQLRQLRHIWKLRRQLQQS